MLAPAAGRLMAEERGSTWLDGLSGTLKSVIVALLCGAFAFAWSSNSNLAILSDRMEQLNSERARGGEVIREGVRELNAKVDVGIGDLSRKLDTATAVLAALTARMDVSDARDKDFERRIEIVETAIRRLEDDRLQLLRQQRDQERRGKQ